MFRKIKKKKGSTLIETAFLLPFIYLLMGIIIVGGQFVINKEVLNSALYSAGRKAMLSADKNTATQVMKDNIAYMMKSGIGIEDNSKNASTVDVTLDDGGNWQYGNNCNITVKIHMKTVFPVPDSNSPTFVGTEKTMTSHLYMKIEAKE